LIVAAAAARGKRRNCHDSQTGLGVVHCIHPSRW
jgi:hypothetical protein